MSWPVILLILIILAIGWSLIIRRIGRVDFGAARQHAVSTEDGWTLALWRYPAAADAPHRGHPVLLCHGLSCNRFSFDLGPDAPSLARHLAGLGFEVFTLELRGRGGSRGAKWWGWSYDDYVLRDAPAALAEVRRLTEAETVHWVGHSMGGLIVMSHLARGGEQIRSAVTIGSCLDYSAGASQFHRARPITGLLRVVPRVPLGGFARLSAPLSSRLDTPIERFNVWLPNIDGPVGRRLNASAFAGISSNVLRQLTTAMEPGGVRPLDGGPPDLERLSQRTPPPLLLLSGDRDMQCPPSAVEHTGSAITGARVIHIGPECPQRYGHFDLLMGQRAREEVFPHITEWLITND